MRTDAKRAPSSRTSMPNRAVPATLAAMSSRGSVRPSKHHSDRGLSAGSEGGSIPAATSARAV